MSIFGVVTEQNDLADKFMQETKERMKNSNVVTNPFNSNINDFVYSEGSLKHLYIVKMTPLYFNFTWFFYPIGVMIYIFRGWIWFEYIILFGCLLGIFWRKEFFYIMMKAGLRKKGYKGEISLVSSDTIIEITNFKGV